ncbi:MAG: BON domain-containing protein [Thermoanaerobaculia bacterium]
MAHRDEDRERFDWSEDRDRDAWEREERARGGAGSYGSYDWERSRSAREWGPPERDWQREADWERAPRSERGRRRWFGHFGAPEGVGSASGYSGMRGPGWTAGGYGDPGYNTSGFPNPDYGSRTGRGETYSPSRSPMPYRDLDESYRDEDYGRAPWDRYASGRWGSGDYRIYEERERDRWEGPYTGRGPKGYQRSDERIREEVSERLMEDDRLDASNIEVRVENGEVTLTGTVDGRRMKRHAEDLAESIRGVRDIHNQLRVEPRQDRERDLSLTPEAERMNRE